MFRRLLGVVAGIATAMVTIMFLEATSHSIYPPPEGMNANDPAQIKAWLEVAPIGALLFLLAAWCLGAFLGGLAAAWICRTGRMLYAGLISGLVLAGTLANLIMIPHPLWFSITSVVMIPMMFWPAAKLAPGQ